MLGITVTATTLLASCVNVDPGPDYEEASRMITDRTGVAETYRPDAEPEALRRRVEEMLQDGLSPENAPRIALLNNGRLQVLFHEIGISRARVVEAGLVSNPSLGVSTRFPQGGGLTSVTLTATQSLVDLLLNPFEVEIARFALEETRMALAQEAIGIVAETRRSCYRILSLERAVATVAADRDVTTRAIRLAEDRMAAGQADRLDVELARAEALDIERELLLLERDRSLEEIHLAELLGIGRWGTTWALSGSLPPPAPDRNDDALLPFAYRQRFDARIAALRIEAARAEVARERHGVFSDVAIGFERERPESPPHSRDRASP
jgi:cobalt-zinc-cadmium efflux system outer membrane protein